MKGARWLLTLALGLSAQAADTLRVAVAQMAFGRTLEDNRARIIEWIERAATARARVAVLPESALQYPPGTSEQAVATAIASIKKAARWRQVYVLFGGWSWPTGGDHPRNWMKVIAPDGNELLHYDKIWDRHSAPVPGLFAIDGVPASVILCADRWLRAVEELPVMQGAQISFELSDNYAAEWVSELEWYWYVPRALRNGIYVVFANSANSPAGASGVLPKSGPRHGHSAVIGPDGAVIAAARGDQPELVVADIDPARATRAGALARRDHPVLGRFWQAGLARLAGQAVPPYRFEPVASAEAELTVAAAQVAEYADPAQNAAAMRRKIAEAARQGADLVAFGELALTGGRCVEAAVAFEAVRAAARDHGVAVAVGLPHREGARWFNSAVVIGKRGELLASYDQLAAAPFAAGERVSSMWFSLDGVAGVVTIGRDGLWNEIAELAAVAGARLHLHLSREPVPDRRAVLRRRQLGAVLASFQTLTVTANALGASAIWDDLRGREETRAVVRGLARPDTGRVQVYSPFSANLIAEAGVGEALIVVRRRIPGPNAHHPRQTANFHPFMRSWYEYGAALLRDAAGR